MNTVRTSTELENIRGNHSDLKNTITEIKTAQISKRKRTAKRKNELKKMRIA